MTKPNYTNLTKEEVLKRTEDILPLINERAIAVEKNRKPDDEVLQKLGEAGVFAICVPKRFGGAELNLDTMVAVTRMIAPHCISTAWIVGFYIGHNVLVCRFPLKCQELAFAKRPYTQTPTGPGQLIAKRVDGGYIVSGRVFWASGIMHADWVMGTANIEGGASEDAIQILVPATAAKIQDVWHMTAMSGTGSNDYELSEVFVPKHMTVLAIESLDGTSEGAMIHSNPMYQQASFMYGEFMGVYVGGLEGIHNLLYQLYKK